MPVDMQAPVQYGGFHFAEPLWFAALLAIPVMLVLYRGFRDRAASQADLERFADRHLLPHLLKNRGADGKPVRRTLLLWSLAWLCGVAAMAGPRWDYEEVQAFRPEQDLVVLLDLGPAMDVQDVKPSRLARARQEIADLLAMNQGISIGLVAYAGVPHMIAPLTDDMRTIGNLLPSLDTSLATITGSRLKPALSMANDMLGHESGNQKSILVVSDGNFDETDIPALAAAAPGASIYTMGVGTDEGAPVSSNGEWLKGADGKMLMARLRADRLRALSDAGHGAYIPADYTDRDTRELLGRIGGTADSGPAKKNTRVWRERFYIAAFLMALLVLPWFRRGSAFPALLFIMLISAGATPAHADWLDLFRNRAQQGLHAFDRGDYDRAAQRFDTPYRRGVAQYRARQYDKAEQSFGQSPGPDAAYNRGNAQMMQDKPEDAIASYESALRDRPGDEAIEHNLEIAKKLAKEKKDRQQQQKDQKSGQGKDGQQQKPDNRKKPGNDQSQSQSGQDQSQNGQGKKDQKQSSQPQQGTPQNGQNQASQQQQGQNAQQQPSDQQSAQQQKPGQDGKQNGEPAKPETGQNGQPEQQTGEQRQDQNAQKGESGEQQQQNGQQNGQQGPQPSGTNSQAEAQQKPDGAPQAGQQQPGQQQSGQPQPGQNGERPADGKPDGAKTQRSQRDIDADQWLNRVQNDPGTFLKNQFIIEDRRSRNPGREQNGE